MDGDERRTVAAALVPDDEATAPDFGPWKHRDLNVRELDVAVELVAQRGDDALTDVRGEPCELGKDDRGKDASQGNADENEVSRSRMKPAPGRHGTRIRNLSAMSTTWGGFREADPPIRLTRGYDGNSNRVLEVG